MGKVQRNTNFYLSILITVIFFIALILAISSGNNVKTLETGSPEATVQKYLQAINDGENEKAATFFTSTNKCTVDDIDRAYIDSNAQVTLDKISMTDKASAIVFVSIQRNNGPLISDPYVENQSFRLKQENGEWKIAGIPWPLYDCGGESK